RRPLMSALVVLLALIGGAVLWIITSYNTLVALRNEVQNALKQIDVQLKRRYDLIPNLIESVKGYMEFEKDTLLAVVQARNQAVAVAPGDLKALSEKEG